MVVFQSHVTPSLLSVVAASFLLSACSAAFDEGARAYLVVEPATVPTFLSDFINVAKAHGLNGEYESSDRGDGHPLHVAVVTDGEWIVTVGSPSTKECPEPPGFDPGRFTLEVQPAMLLPFPEKKAVTLARTLVGDLERRGYRVTSEPAPCRSRIQ